MSFDESPDYDPFVVEQYVVRNMQFFKRWTLNNITLNQLNSILLEQQLMPATAQEDVSRATDLGAVSSSTEDLSVQVRQP